MTMSLSPSLGEVGEGSSNAARREAVRFEHVDFSHPNGAQALSGISITFSEGELVAILGTNGAGKSTLVRHINGLLKPTHGRVVVFGQDTKKVSAASLSRRVGIVFQNANNQLFAQSVKKEVEFALRNFGFENNIVEQRTEWALETFSLREYAERPPIELSGGEKKRLCIALVLAWNPDILILDEPTVGQDFDQKEKLTETIKLLLSQRKTIILVTHDVEFVWPLQPRTVFMAEGRIVADGDSQSILANTAVTSKASVLPPQLVAFAKIMGWTSGLPVDAYQAKARLDQEFFGGKAGGSIS